MAAARAIDAWVNVAMAELGRPDYLVAAAEGLFKQGSDFFRNYSIEEMLEGMDALLWHLAFMALTIVVVSGGVRAGIERAALVLMPLLGLLVVGLAIYASTLEGASAGYAYYFSTDFAANQFIGAMPIPRIRAMPTARWTVVMAAANPMVLMKASRISVGAAGLDMLAFRSDGDGGCRGFRRRPDS